MGVAALPFDCEIEVQTIIFLNINIHHLTNFLPILLSMIFIKICFVFYLSLQAKINIPEGFKPVESMGLYVLVNCFKPGILNYQSSILDIGMYAERKKV